MLKIIEVPTSSAIRCNRCEKEFEAPSGLVRQLFYGQPASRIETFWTCPHCQQTDSHWVYSSDIIPTFEGSKEKVRKATRQWLNNN